MAKGKNPFYKEEQEEKIIVTEQKAEMFEEKVTTPKVEAKSDRIIAYLEPSLKKRMVKCAKNNDVKYAVIVRAAIEEYLEKRGL